MRHPMVRRALLATLGALAACSSTSSDEPHSDVEPKTRSVTPALVKNIMTGVQAFPLLSSDDVLPQSPSYIFGGSADGAGLLHNSDGTYTLLVNNEDNFAVSRITLDKTFAPLKGEYLVNSTTALYRLCSASLATPEEHGFGPLFLTAGESSAESMTHAVNPFAAAPTTTKLLTGFGRWSAENAMPLPKTAFPGKTVVVISDDDSGADGGQVAIYVSNTVGDLDNGKVYVLTRNDGDAKETTMVPGTTYPVTFKEIPNIAGLTGAQINARSTALAAVKFGRVEDADYRKGGINGGREVYFTVTGQATTGVNADASRSKYGRIYKLLFNETDPTKGSLEVVLNGDDRNGPAKTFQDPDNIVATTNYLYIMEDPNGYGDETHDAYLYQYNLATKTMKVVFEIDHRRTAADAAKYNVGGTSALGSWELSGMIDISSQTNLEGAFLIGVQAHTWTAAKYAGVDGGTLRPNENQASQLLLLTGLPR